MCKLGHGNTFMNKFNDAPPWDDRLLSLSRSSEVQRTVTHRYDEIRVCKHKFDYFVAFLLRI